VALVVGCEPVVCRLERGVLAFEALASGSNFGVISAGVGQRVGGTHVLADGRAVSGGVI
jgi:hypothetical protein